MLGWGFWNRSVIRNACIMMRATFKPNKAPRAEVLSATSSHVPTSQRPAQAFKESLSSPRSRVSLSFESRRWMLLRVKGVPGILVLCDTSVKVLGYSTGRVEPGCDHGSVK